MKIMKRCVSNMCKQGQEGLLPVSMLYMNFSSSVKCEHAMDQAQGSVLSSRVEKTRFGE